MMPIENIDGSGLNLSLTTQARNAIPGAEVMRFYEQNLALTCLQGLRYREFVPGCRSAWRLKSFSVCLVGSAGAPVWHCLLPVWRNDALPRRD
jgi:hypothetical protein